MNARQPMTGAPSKPSQRGTFLSALIILNGAAITLASFVLVLAPGLRQSLGDLPGWFSPFVLALLLARLAALAGIWRFRRWGVYAFWLLECVEVGTGLFVFTGVRTLPQRALALPAALVLLAIWILALRPRWQAFR